MTKFLKALWDRIMGSRAPQRTAAASSYAVVRVAPRRASRRDAEVAAALERAQTSAQKAQSQLSQLTAAVNRRLDSLAPSYTRRTAPKRVAPCPMAVVVADAVASPGTGPVIAARCAAEACRRSAGFLFEMLAALAADQDPVRVLYRFSNIARRSSLVKSDPRLSETLAERAKSAYAQRKSRQTRFVITPTGLVEEIIL